VAPHGVHVNGSDNRIYLLFMAFVLCVELLYKCIKKKTAFRSLAVYNLFKCFV